MPHYVEINNDIKDLKKKSLIKISNNFISYTNEKTVDA